MTTPTTFSMLRAASGLSQSEAAAVLRIGLSSVKKFETGRRTPSPGIIDELAEIVQLIQKAADNAEQMIDEQVERFGGHPESLHLGVCADDHEANALGFPAASVHRMAISRAAAYAISAGINVVIGYRGADPETAAAVDAHEL